MIIIKRKDKIIISLLAIWGILLIAAPVYITFQNKSKEKEINNAIDEFHEKIEIQKFEKFEEMVNDLIMPKETPSPTTEPPKNTVATVGVMTIPKISLTAPIAMTTEPYIMKSHIGTYSTLDQIEDIPSKDTMIGFAAHSSVGKCGHCFFNRLEELEVGDLIEIEWEDGDVYVYSTTYMVPNEDKTLNYYYETHEGKDMIVLTTCTDGNKDVRTIVQAELIDIK